MKTLMNSRHERSFVAGLLLLAAYAAWCADVEFYGVVKEQRFVQDNPTAPGLVNFEDSEAGGGPPFVFNSFVDLAGSNAATSATLTLPGGAERTLELEWDGFTREFSDGAAFKTQLDLVYSNATYTLALQTENDGNKTLSLTFPVADAYPNPPRISNFTAAQSINAAAGFTVNWDEFAGGTENDFILFEIYDPDADMTVFETAGPGEPGSLNGTSTSVLVPAGTLAPGRSYEALIFFARIVDVDDTTYGEGVTGVAAFLAETTFRMRTTGGTDFMQPNLISFTPFNTQMDVKSRAVVAFTFSEAMNTSLPLSSSISWSGNVNGGLMDYAWSVDGQTLFAIYPPGFPTNALVTWELNPGGSPMNVRDLAGNLLPNWSGSFNTGGETGTGETDVSFLALVKGRIFRQTTSVPQSLDLYQFSLTSDLNLLNSVTNGAVTLPNARAVTPELDSGDAFDFESSYSSQAQLDSFFPDGAHQARFDTVHDGTRTFNFTLTGSAYPNAPQVLDFAATQTVNPTNAFVLSWGEFTGGTSGDFISLEIDAADGFTEGGVFETPGFGEPGALNGTHTSVTIPAFTLAPGRTYECQLFFVKASQVDVSTYPGVIAASGYLSLTSFDLTTSGEPIAATLRISANPATGALITITGERNRLYTVESADSLTDGPVQWMQRYTGSTSTNISGFNGSFHFVDDLATPSGMRYYRAREEDFSGGGF